jgi:2-dehydro-3-deoxyphosphogluconate aldolase / (4S)-4-hydroxy-2-oxoglutarate aldolase
MNVSVPIVGILRGFAPNDLPGITGAVQRGGLQMLEVTMNSPGAAEQISMARELAGGSLAIGAGTVTSLPLLKTALAAGADFIVTPTLHREVVRECVKDDIPIYPGALSPTEILEAWELGATMVKIFPAETGGAASIKSLVGPFPAIRLMPTGGVDLETLPSLILAGASGAGVGSPLFNRDRIAAQDWRWLEEQARRYVRCWTQRFREQR